MLNDVRPLMWNDLEETVNTLDTETVENLLVQAAAAKQAVQQCRNQHKCSRAI